MFTGTIITPDQHYQVKYIYNVRPKGSGLEYARDRLLMDLKKNGIASSLKNNIAYVIPANLLVDYWIEKAGEDPYYFLDEDTKKWVIPKLNQLGRRFQLEDFE